MSLEFTGTAGPPRCFHREASEFSGLAAAYGAALAAPWPRRHLFSLQGSCGGKAQTSWSLDSFPSPPARVQTRCCLAVGCLQMQHLLIASAFFFFLSPAISSSLIFLLGGFSGLAVSFHPQYHISVSLWHLPLSLLCFLFANVRSWISIEKLQETNHSLAALLSLSSC